MLETFFFSFFSLHLLIDNINWFVLNVQFKFPDTLFHFTNMLFFIPIGVGMEEKLTLVYGFRFLLDFRTIESVE